MKFLSELMENIIVKEGGSIKRLMRSEQFMAWWSSLLPRFYELQYYEYSQIRLKNISENWITSGLYWLMDGCVLEL